MPSLVGHWGGGGVWCVTSGEFPSNAYICGTGDNQAILIDGGLDPKLLEEAVQHLGLVPSAVFCTHGHFDHAGSAAYFQKKYGCPIYLHGSDHKVLKSSNFLLMAFKMASRVEQPSNITPVIGGQRIDVAGQPLIFHGAPGHTPGSCVIELGSALFTGDTIYSKGVGLSNMPGEEPETLKRSILALWPMLTSDRTVYPGHGSHASGYEVRTHNILLLTFLGLLKPQSSEIQSRVI